nr:MAG TPA: hypothetical protein [Caudoviricetes sp.]
MIPPFAICGIITMSKTLLTVGAIRLFLFTLIEFPYFIMI